MERLRALCPALPEVEERGGHGEPSRFAGSGRRARMFAMLADHRHDDRPAFCCAAPGGAQQRLIEEGAERCFRPPYVRHRGWLGVRPDGPAPDRARTADLVADAHALVGPSRQRSSGRSPPNRGRLASGAPTGGIGGFPGIGGGPCRR